MPELKGQMANETFLEKQEENIAIHIFSVSAAMIGACLTMIGLLNITYSLKKIESLGDELVALDAILFLASCIVSYIAMKTKLRRRRYLLEKTADVIFLAALLTIALACILIARQFL